jgi:hypothetical protein
MDLPFFGVKPVENGPVGSRFFQLLDPRLDLLHAPAQFFRLLFERYQFILPIQAGSRLSGNGA